MSDEMKQVMDRRNNGETWHAIAKSMSIAESTLRGRLRAAGLISRTGTRNGRKAAASVATAAATAVPTAQQSGGFVAPTWYPLLRYAANCEKGAMLFGPRGCGKSTAIRELAKELNHPTVTMQCAANMQIDALLGCWTSQSGTLSFIDGPLTIALRSGAWLLAEEANVIHPGVWSLVNTLTDQTGEGLRLPTGEVVNPHPDFRLVLIYNEGYTGTREVNAALKDRLMPIYCGYLAAADEVALLSIKTGATMGECHRVQVVAETIRAAALRFDLSPRSLVRWIKLVKQAGLTWGEAYEKSIVDLAGPADTAAPQRAVLEEIARNTVMQWS